jgi:peptidyl-tRNA hydrolase, PTH1 family
VERFAARHHIPLAPSHPLCMFGAGAIDGRPVTLALPRTFMNDSGRAVAALLSGGAGTTATMVVVYDDMDLPLGRLRLRFGGQDGGHQGVRSIIAAVQSDQFCRLRLGIGRPAAGEEAAEYVLAPVPSAERPAVEDMTALAVDAIRGVILEGFETAMNRYNQRPSG